ncbi:MAG: hypothetical protein LBK82_14255 [Planctomycetaceae bacterium]|nr:hypothetical protein [Planctomycetaceae bacterium]
MTPKRKATLFASVNLIHCRRVRRRDLLAKGRPPYNCLSLTRIPMKYYQIILRFSCKTPNPIESAKFQV